MRKIGYRRWRKNEKLSSSSKSQKADWDRLKRENQPVEATVRQWGSPGGRDIGKKVPKLKQEYMQLLQAGNIKRTGSKKRAKTIGSNEGSRTPIGPMQTIWKGVRVVIVKCKGRAVAMNDEIDIMGKRLSKFVQVTKSRKQMGNKSGK